MVAQALFWHSSTASPSKIVNAFLAKLYIFAHQPLYSNALEPQQKLDDCFRAYRSCTANDKAPLNGWARRCGMTHRRYSLRSLSDRHVTSFSHGFGVRAAPKRGHYRNSVKVNQAERKAQGFSALTYFGTAISEFATHLFPHERKFAVH